MVTEIGGMNETFAAALFEPMGRFVLACQLSSVIIDTFLAGVFIMQVIQYYTYQPKDKWWTKLIVAHCLCMNILVTIYYWVYTQYLLVQNFGYWLPWLEVHWLALMPTFDTLTVSVVQSFFAYRAFLLNRRNWFILILAEFLILTAFGGAIGVTVIFGRGASLLDASKCGPALITWNATTTAADVLIAGSILYGLLKSKSGWAHTDKLVTRLIRLTFETQLPPTCLAIGYVVEWIIQPDSLLGGVFQALQIKAYTVGLLVCLNARVSFNASGEDGSATNNPPQVFAMSSRRNPTQIQVDVETETYIHNDGQGWISSSKKADSLSDLEEDKALTYVNNSKSRLTGPDSHI